jgi:hypothetical protein
LTIGSSTWGVEAIDSTFGELTADALSGKFKINIAKPAVKIIDKSEANYGYIHHTILTLIK